MKLLALGFFGYLFVSNAAAGMTLTACQARLVHTVASVNLAFSDPHQHFPDLDSAVQLAMSDKQTVDRLSFLHRRSIEKWENRTAQIVIAGFKTEFTFEDRMYIDDQPIDVHFIYEHPDHEKFPDDPTIPENPNLTVVGGIAELVAQEAKNYLSNRYWKTVQRNVLAVQEAHHEFAEWNDVAELYRQFDVVFTKRMVWYAKLDFYERYLFDHDELTLPSLEALRRSRTQGEDMRIAFTEFYRLDTKLVQFVWWDFIPDIDLTFANPMGKIYPRSK